MVRAQRTSFLWDGKEKYICPLSSKCAKLFQVYLPLRTTWFPQLLKSEPTHVWFFRKYQWITKIRNIFSFYTEAISKEIHTVFYIKFNGIGSISRSFFIVKSVSAVVWFNEEMVLYSIFCTKLISKTQCRVNKVKSFFPFLLEVKRPRHENRDILFPDEGWK